EVHDRVPGGNGHGPGLWDLTGREYLIIVPLVAAILFLGIYPKPVLARINPSAQRSCVSVRVHAEEPPPAMPSNGVMAHRQQCDVGPSESGTALGPEPSPTLVPLGEGGAGS